MVSGRGREPHPSNSRDGDDTSAHGRKGTARSHAKAVVAEQIGLLDLGYIL